MQDWCCGGLSPTRQSGQESTAPNTLLRSRETPGPGCRQFTVPRWPVFCDFRGSDKRMPVESGLSAGFHQRSDRLGAAGFCTNVKTVQPWDLRPHVPELSRRWVSKEKCVETLCVCERRLKLALHRQPKRFSGAGFLLFPSKRNGWTVRGGCREEIDAGLLQCGPDLLYRVNRHSLSGVLDSGDHLTADPGVPPKTTPAASPAGPSVKANG